MHEYLEPTDPDAFLDMEKRSKEDFSGEKPVECPKCKGHGGWHLRIDAYGKGKHFDAHCVQCHGHGYVAAGSKDETCPAHDYQEMSQAEAKEREIPHFGMCYHVTECTKCGQTWAYSSD